MVDRVDHEPAACVYRYDFCYICINSNSGIQGNAFARDEYIEGDLCVQKVRDVYVSRAAKVEGATPDFDGQAGVRL